MEDLTPYVAPMLEGMLLWASDSKNRFKLKVRAVVERMARRCGFDAVAAAFPASDARLLAHIRKEQGRKQKRRDGDDDAVRGGGWLSFILPRSPAPAIAGARRGITHPRAVPVVAADAFHHGTHGACLRVERHTHLLRDGEDGGGGAVGGGGVVCAGGVRARRGGAGARVGGSHGSAGGGFRAAGAGGKGAGRRTGRRRGGWILNGQGLRVFRMARVRCHSVPT